MIRVQDVGRPPTLAQHEAEWNREAVEQVEAAVAAGQPTDYDWPSGRYAADDVKDALDRMFAGKCAYCECYVAHVAWLHVEYYRPKKEVDDGRNKLRPGYYWLGYSWDNMLLACPRCNQRPNKGNKFPVGGPRARRPHEPLADELPLLLDPRCDDPHEHLCFDTATGAATERDGSPRGRATIDVCGLDRDELRDKRRQVSLWVEACWIAYCVAHQDGNEQAAEEWMQRLRAAVSPAGECSAMAAATLEELGLL